MLRELVKVANYIDTLGLQREADFIDSLILKEATRVIGAEDWLQAFVDTMEGTYNWEFDGDILIGEDGETIQTPETPEEGRRILLSLGMDDSEVSDILFSVGNPTDVEMSLEEEPPISKEDIAKVFEDYFKKIRVLDDLKVTELGWNGETTEWDSPHYDVKSIGTYRSNIYSEGDIYGDEEPIGKSESKEYPIDTHIWVLPEGEKSGMPVVGLDGKTYYLYAED